ncbi:Pvc16 family protein [Lentzea sp. NPDC059081]|uniref:Pvc16 family protein n=1 Tax=Lentzea sp. NPDC059081 TaxID=3346719 RepID=UPI003687DAAF
MIPDVDEALRALLTAFLPDRTDIRFDRPGPRPDTAVHLLLHTVGEVPGSRPSDPWQDVRDEKGAVVGRQPAPLFFHLTYTVTARAESPAVEHDLLDHAVRACVTHEVLPQDLLPPALAETGLPVGTALRAHDDLGAEHPYLVLDVTAPLVLPVDHEVGAPVRRLHLEAGRVARTGSERRVRTWPRR